MPWSFRLGRIAGTEIRIHVTFLLFLVWIGLLHYLRGGSAAALDGVLFILALFGCVLLHELGHALAARRYGIPTPDITLLPIGGVARMARIPDDPRQELVIAVAGPLVNVAIAAVLYLVLGGPDLGGIAARLDQPTVAIGERLLLANVVLVLFNLIPAFPMDGGRVLRSLLALRLPYVRATQIAASLGQAIAFGFGFLGLLGFNPLLLFIALFVYLGAAQEAALAQMRATTRWVPVVAAMVTDVRALPEEGTLQDAVEALLRTLQSAFPVVDATGRVVGVVTRDRLIAALAEHGLQAPLRLALRPAPTVSHRALLDEAYARMEEAGVGAVPVVDDAGRLVGLLTPDNVGEMLLVQGALARAGVPGWRRVPSAA